MQYKIKKEKFKRGKSKVKNAKKETYDGLNFESRLEVNCYKMLKENNILFEYIPKSFLLVDVFKTDLTEYTFKTNGNLFVSKPNKLYHSINYTPDFIGSNWVLETKGLRTPLFAMRWKLFIRMLGLNANNPYKHLFIAGNKKQLEECIKIIKSLN